MFENVNFLFVGGCLFFLGLIFLIIGLVLDEDVSTTTTSATTSSTSSSSTMSTSSSTTSAELTPAESFSAMRDDFASNLATGFTMGSGNGGDNFEVDFAGSGNIMTLSTPVTNLNLNDILYIELIVDNPSSWADLNQLGSGSIDRIAVATIFSHGASYTDSAMSATYLMTEDVAISGHKPSWTSSDSGIENNWNTIVTPLATNVTEIDISQTVNTSQTIGILYRPATKSLFMYTDAGDSGSYRFLRTSTTTTTNNQVTSWPTTETITDMYVSFGSDELLYDTPIPNTVLRSSHVVKMDINLGQKAFTHDIKTLIDVEVAGGNTVMESLFPSGTVIKNYLGEVIDTLA